MPGYEGISAGVRGGLELAKVLVFFPVLVEVPRV